MMTMISEIQKKEYLLEWKLRKEELDEAAQIIYDYPELGNYWRQIALGYSDLEDLENSIKFFKLGYKSGDKKTLPWLVELLNNFEPDDSELPKLQQDLHTLRLAKDFDVHFSLGNMYLSRGEFAELNDVWADYLHTNNHLIDLNLAAALDAEPENELLRKSLNFDDSSNSGDVFSLIFQVIRRNLDLGYEALWVMITFYLHRGDHLDKTKVNVEGAVEKALEFAKTGHIFWIIDGLLLALAVDSPLVNEFDILLSTHGIKEFIDELGIDLEDRAVQRRFLSIPQKSFSSQKQVQEIFAQAEEASKSGDLKREIDLWISGAKLGDANCFYNFSIALGNSLGIQANLMGSSGGDGLAWGDLAKNIQFNEQRMFSSDVHQLDTIFGHELIENRRKGFGFSKSMPLGPKPLLNRDLMQDILDILSVESLTHLKLSENILVLPYGHNGVSVQVFLELIQDDDAPRLMVYVPSLIGLEKLNFLELNIIKMCFRNSFFIFPLSAWFSMEKFLLVPDDKKPNFFVNSQKIAEIWTSFGSRIEEMVVELLPIQSEKTQYYLGLAIDMSLQSDHLQRAVIDSLNVAVGATQLIIDLYFENTELFEKCFSAKPLVDDVTKLILVDEEKQSRLGVKRQLLLDAEKQSVKKGDPKPLLKLPQDEIRLALRVAAMSTDYERKPFPLADLILERAQEYEEDVFLREYLNNIAWSLRKSKNLGEAWPYFEGSARLGGGNALATLTWESLLSGKHQEGIDYFNSNYYKMMITRESDLDFQQAANARSNNALNRWALGASPEKLKAIWADEYLQGNHVESKFYPILIDFEAGNDEAAYLALKELSDWQMRDLKQTFEEDQNNPFWFGALCKRALQLLSRRD